MSRARLSLLLLLVPALMASRCKKKNEIEEPPVDTLPVDAPSPEVQLQVISIDPAWGEAGAAFVATLYGSAFERGAQVSFNTVPAAKVAFVDENTLTVTVPALNEGYADITVRNPDGTQATLRRGLTIAASRTAMCDRATIYFDLDSNALRQDARQTLDGLVPCLSRRPEPVRLEGHCDERGTTDYNLALGQRRADAVKGYLISQGVSPSRIQTVSYGEERPMRTGSTEESWSLNRRVELKVSP